MRLHEIAKKPQTIKSATTKSGMINRKKANAAVDPNGYFKSTSAYINVRYHYYSNGSSNHRIIANFNMDTARSGVMLNHSPFTRK